MKRVLTALCIISTLVSVAQQVRTPVSSAYTRLNTYSQRQSDAFSFTGNQAALASVKNFTAGAFAERRFLLRELSMYTAVAAIPTASGTFAFQGNYMGNVDYNESTASIAYGRRLSEKVDIGLQFNYNSFKLAGYGTASAVNFDAALLFHLTDQLHTGIHVYNPTGVRFGKAGEERLPVIVSGGFGYDVSSKFFISAQVEKTEDRPVNIISGIQYGIDEKLLSRAGIHSASSAFYLGLGYVLSDVRVDATASVHPQLGITPGILIIFNRRD